jgi:hypothetical protein
LAEQCDIAEWVWGQEEDRREMLRLVALIIGGLGGEGLDSYVAPSERLAELLAAPPAPDRAAQAQEARAAAIAEFVAAAGGEVG